MRKGTAKLYVWRYCITREFNSGVLHVRVIPPGGIGALAVALEAEAGHSAEERAEDGGHEETEAEDGENHQPLIVREEHF